MAPEWQDPAGVPISAILFGGRRASTVPLVTEARDWRHGVFLGSIMSSEKTAAASGDQRNVRFDPFAMLPFMGYNVGDYIAHWLEIERLAPDPAVLPRMYWVNWFRRDSDGSFIWPGFGENSRVLKWVHQRVTGEGGSEETPIGIVPSSGALDVDGLDIPTDQLESLLDVDLDAWKDELELIREHFEFIGDRLPDAMRDELGELGRRLGS
jgi:phosphoenolpyruvate carboxykinase (GTP)